MPGLTSASPSFSLRLHGIRSLPEIYAALALLLVGVYSFVTPPFFGADELAHSERALEIAHGELVLQFAQPSSLAERSPAASVHAEAALAPQSAGERGFGASLDSGFLAAAIRLTAVQRDFIARYPSFTHRPDGRFPPALFAAENQVRWSRQLTFASFRNTGAYPPVFYLPAALAWGLAERANLTILHALLWARLCTGFCAVALGWLALRLAGRLRPLFFFVLLLPALTSIEASCSQDAALIAAATLACSLIANAVDNARPPRPLPWACISVLIGLCVAARPPYLPLVLLLLLPWLEQQDRKHWSWLSPALGMAAACLLAFGWMTVVHKAGIAHSPVADPAAQTHFILAHPVHTAGLLAKKTLQKTPEMIVRIVEPLEMRSARLMAVLFTVHILAFFLVVLSVPRIRLRTASARTLLPLVLLVIAAGVSLVEYLIWNPPGAATLEGLQARYYLPLLPFALSFVLPRKAPSSAVERSPSRDRWLATGTAVFLSGVLLTPFLLAHRNYGTGLGTAVTLWFR